MGVPCLGEKRFHISDALEDAKWKTNFKSDGPTMEWPVGKIRKHVVESLRRLSCSYFKANNSCMG